MNRKLVFALSLFVLLCSSLYVRFNSVEVESSNGYPVAPDFILNDIDGNSFSLNDYRGRPVLLDFFHTNCTPSVNQFSELMILHEDFGEKLVIISISPENETALRDFRDNYNISWTIAKDTAGVFDVYHVQYIPTLVIIDQQGYICYTHVGLTEESLLRPEIESLLPKTIYVDDGNVSGPWNGTKEHPYQNITSGLEHASDNDIVFVQNGTYYEHVTINKSISLIGENKYNTIIDGNSAGTIVNITASNVRITSFIIRKSRSAYPDCGIYLSSNGNNISYNFITDNYLGIWLEDSSSNTISGNTITNNDDGIWLDYSSNNNIYKNNIANNIRGIKQDNSPNNAIYGNNVTTSTFKNSFGIRLIGSSNSDVSGNTFMNCGIIVDDSYSNVVESNTVNRKPLVYLEGISNHTVQEAGQVIAVNCSDIRANNLNLSDATVGIELWETNNSEIGNNSIFANSFCGVILEQSHNNDIWGNNITENSDAIRLGWFGGSSNNNTISGNSVVDNENGIYLGFSSNNNTISKNEIKENYWNGIYVYSSNFNIIMGNNINGNRPGIYFTDSSDNVVFHNNFISNSGQVYTNSINVWDYGYPCEGNYWSDYNGTDANNDGIGDSYYVIDVNNTDHFPLMDEFHKYHIRYIEPGFTLTLISNSTISNFVVWFWIEHPEYRGIDFNVAGETGYGFCRLCIPKNLMAPPYTVTIDNGQTPVTCYNETLFDNSTHRWIYFAYLHSDHQIEIIAEFPSFLILPLFMIATLLVVIVYKKREV